MRVQVPLSAPSFKILLCYNVTMRNTSTILNSAGLVVSFFCFLHCVLVILAFTGILNSSFKIIQVFENPYNHAVLVLSGITLATLSLIKPNFNSLLKKLEFEFKGLTSLIFIIGTSLLIASFYVYGIYSEILVILGALCLLNMHTLKLIKSQ